jgi:ABC-type Na+ efflux pump permease subunit
MRTSLFVLTTASLTLSACNRTTDSADALYNTVVLDATKTGLGEYVAQTMGGGRLANQYMPLVRVVPLDSLVQAESTVVKEMKEGRASGYLVIDSNTVRAKSAQYYGKRADSKEDMELVRGAIKENVLAMEMRNRGIARELVDSLTAKPVALEIRK